MTPPRQFEIYDRVREGVLRDLAARGFTHFRDGTPLRRSTPSRTFESMFGLDAEISELEKMMRAGEGLPDSIADLAKNLKSANIGADAAAALLKSLKPILDADAYAEVAKSFRDNGLIKEGGELGMDGASFDGLFPDARRIINETRQPLRKPPAHNASAAGSFDRMFPGAQRIGRAA